MREIKNDLEIAEFLLKIEKKAYKAVKKQKVQVKDKKSHDLVTNYDFFIEKFIIERLKKKFPNTKIVSEEFNSDQEAKGTYFVIDPVDGTINFANGLNMWGIQIAYIKENETLASAIYMPYFGAFHAAKGYGAFKDGKKFICQKRDLKHSLICIDNHDAKAFCTMWTTLADSVLQQRFSGCACYNLVMTAQGNFGVYIINADAHQLDVLPGILIAKEASCIFKTENGRLIAATTQDILDETIAILKK